MNRTLIGCGALLLLLSGCGRSDEELRQMMRAEIAQKMEKTFITDAQVIGPYSPAIRAGHFVFISGQIGMDPVSMQLVGNDLESQTRQAMMNLMGVLKTAGCDSSDVVQCTVYLRDMKEFSRMNLIYGGFFAEGHYPTRSTVEVANLPKDARVEISAIAMR